MAARQELHSGLSEMATQTQNYKLHKFELKDAPADITAINASMDIIDTQLKALADGKFDKTGGTISGNLVVNGSTTLKKLTASELDLNGNADVSGTLKVAGATTLTGKLTANGGVTTKALTATNLDLNGNGDVSGSLTVHGDLNAQGGLNVTDITATGATTLVNLNAANITATGTLKVNGATTLTGLLAANGGVTTKKVTATELDLNGNGDVSGNLNVGGLLQVTGDASLNGGGTVKTPADYVNTSDIVPASWVWKLIRRYGLAGGINTAVDVSDAYPSRDLNDVDATGFYTCSSTVANSPKGEEAQTFTGLLIHVHRRFNAGPVAWQMCVQQTTPNVIFYRVKNGSVWSEWFKIAQDNDVVHLSGSETIVGEKSIKNHINLIRAVNKGDKSTISHRQIKWLDPNGESMGLISLRTGTDGSTRLEFYAYKNESGNTSEAAHFFIEVTETGVARCYLPATADNANSEEGVTARWARSKFLALDGSTSMAANLKLGPHAPVIESTQTVDSNDSIPDVSRFNGHSVYAENGDRIAYIQLASRNDGRREYNMYVRNPYVYGEVFHGLKWGFAADASFYAQLTQGPVTESNDNSIATTAWVTQKVNSNKLTIGNPVAQGTSWSGSCTKNTIVYINSSGSVNDVKVNGTTVANTRGYHDEYAQQVTLFVPAGGSWSIGGAGNGSITSVLYQEIN